MTDNEAQPSINQALIDRSVQSQKLKHRHARTAAHTHAHTHTNKTKNLANDWWSFNSDETLGGVIFLILHQHAIF